MSVLILNDLHLGVQRAAGTTVASAYALRRSLLLRTQELLYQSRHRNVIVNGDLFDEFSVPMSDVLEAYHIFAGWLVEDSGHQLVLGAGNHDLAKDSSRLSSFEFLAHVLLAQFPDQVQLITDPTMVFQGVYMIPHVANQDLLDLAISDVPHNVLYVLFHANYDNNFAAQQDHSLNVTREQARGLPGTLVFGHEHPHRTELNGKVICTGNQFPSSIADCLGPNQRTKQALVIGNDFTHSFITTWEGDKHYLELPWDTLDTAPQADFVRVVGEASAEQAADVVNAIAKYRQRASQVFVVTNAVSVAGMAEMAALPTNMEVAKSFDVLAYLLENLDPEQAEAVKTLLADAEPKQEAA